VWIPIRNGIPGPTPVFTVIGHLKNGVSVASAEEESNTIFQGLPFAVYKRLGPLFAEYGARFVNLQTQETAVARAPLFLVFGVAMLLLVVACANVAGLLFGRGLARRQEVAMRTALGASRARITRQLLTENLVLAFAGGLLGIGLAWLGIRGLIYVLPPEIPRASSILLDGRVLAFTILCSAFAALSFRLVPALFLIRGDIDNILKSRTAGYVANRNLLDRSGIVDEKLPSPHSRGSEPDVGKSPRG
jgi:putative ABC transport system permease protein